MINTQTFSNNEHQKIFLFSDLHAYHAREFILTPRGFTDEKTALDTFKSNYRKKVRSSDIVFFLGDSIVGAGTDSYDKFMNLIRELEFSELYIMPGNHPAGLNTEFNRLHKDGNVGDKYFRTTADLGHKKVHFIPNYHEIFVNRQHIVMSHYPILSWNGIGKGSWMLYGHVHNNLTKTDWIRNNYLKGKCLDVSPESIGMEPISFDDVSKIMSKKELLSVDHH